MESSFLILWFMDFLNKYSSVTCRSTVKPLDVTAITPHVHHRHGWYSVLSVAA